MATRTDRAPSSPSDWRPRLGMGMDLARLAALFFIVSGHMLQIRGLYGHFSHGLGYPSAPGDFPLWKAGLAGQTWAGDRVFLGCMYWYWSYNYAFFLLSGMSLWFSTRLRGYFDLRQYMTSRFYGVYLGYAVAAVAAFVFGVTVLGHTPGEHDFNYLLLGVARARETVFYNDTLWFMAVLLGLYLVFPLVALAYNRLGWPGLAALWGAAWYWLEARHVLADYGALFSCLPLFLTGAALAELLLRLGPVFDRLGGRVLVLLGLVCALGLGWRFYGLVYVQVAASGLYQNDTHATGMVLALLAVALGFVLPGDRPGLVRALRALGRATFSVYLYHYLLVRLANSSPGGRRFLDHLASLAFPPFSDHLLAFCAGLYAVLLLIGLLYQRVFDRVLVGGLRKAFDQSFQVC
ncbi:hypothetical protein JCM15519_33920 [Fundidesulfovibrio butyratiphilus]